MPLQDINLDLNPVKDPNLRYNLEKIKRWAKSVNQRLSLVVTQTGPPNDEEPEPGGGGGTPSTHVFDGATSVTLSSAFVTAPDNALLTVINDAAEVRFKNFPPQTTTLDYTGTEVWLNDAESYMASTTPEIYRGLSITGSVTPLAIAAGAGPVEAISNGTFEGGTYNSRTAAMPNYWVIADDGSMRLVTPGFGGTGYALSIDVTSGQQAATRFAEPSFIGNGTNTCTGDIGGPGITNGTHTTILLEKNSTYVLTFQMRLLNSSTGMRAFGWGIYAHETPTEYGTCSSLGYSLGGASASGARSATFSSWSSARSTNASFVDVPGDDTYHLYTATIDTSGVGADAGPGTSFYASIYFNGGLSGTGTWEIDLVSLLIPGTSPPSISQILSVYGQSFDELTYIPTLTSDNGTFTFSGISNLYSVPTLKPVTGVTSEIVLSTARGATFGFSFDSTSHLGTLTAADVASAYFNEPEFGSDPYAGFFAGNVGIASNKALRILGTSTGFTSITGGAQGATDIAYVLPTAQGAASTFLGNDGAGNLSWATPAGGGGSGGTSIVADTEIASGTLTGSQANIDITSISGTYDELVLYLFARTDRAVVQESVNIALNGDTTAANYQNGGFFAAENSSTPSHDVFGGTSRAILTATGSSATADQYAAGNVWMPQYANAKRKILLARHGIISTTAAADSEFVAREMLWTNTAAITQITLTPATGGINFVAGTWYRLVGRKNMSIVGSPGEMGPPGADGEEGEPSWPIMGQTGSPGPTGASGSQGVMGPPGFDGPEGDEGPMGVPGPAGSAGAAGATGSAGVNGPPGVDGQDGEDALWGPQGIQGATGPTGATGATGPIGPVMFESVEDWSEGFQGITTGSVAQGTGTTSRLPKWTNGPAGILGDSIFTDSGSSLVPTGDYSINIGGPSNHFATAYLRALNGDVLGLTMFAEGGGFSIYTTNSSSIDVGRFIMSGGSDNVPATWTDTTSTYANSPIILASGTTITTTGTGSVGTSLNPLNPVYAQEMDSGTTSAPVGRNTVLRAWNFDGSASFTATLQGGAGGIGNFALSSGGFTAAASSTSSFNATSTSGTSTHTTGVFSSTVAAGGQAWRFDTTNTINASGTLLGLYNNGTRKVLWNNDGWYLPETARSPQIGNVTKPFGYVYTVGLSNSDNAFEIWGTDGSSVETQRVNLTSHIGIATWRFINTNLDMGGGSIINVGSSGSFRGAPGEDGEDGMMGFPGLPGPAGAAGAAGAAGVQGRPGLDGDDADTSMILPQTPTRVLPIVEGGTGNTIGTDFASHRLCGGI